MYGSRAMVLVISMVLHTHVLMHGMDIWQTIIHLSPWGDSKTQLLSKSSLTKRYFHPLKIKWTYLMSPPHLDRDIQSQISIVTLQLHVVIIK